MSSEAVVAVVSDVGHESTGKEVLAVGEEDQGSYEAAVAAMKSLPVILPPRPVPMPALRPRPPVVTDGHFAARAARPLPFSAKVTIFALEEQNERQDVLLAEQRQRTGLIVALMSQYVNFAPDVQSAEDAFREAVQREEDRHVMLLVEDYIGSHQQALIHTLERLQLQGEELFAEAMSIPPQIFEEEEYELSIILRWHKVHRPFHYCKKTGKKFDVTKRLDENSPTRRNLTTLLIPAPPTDALPFARAEGRRSWGKERECQFERRKHEMTLVDWVNEEALGRMEIEADWVRGVLYAEGSELEIRRRLENPSPRVLRSNSLHVLVIEDRAINADPKDYEAAAIRIQCCGRQYLSRAAVRRRREELLDASESRVGAESNASPDEDDNTAASSENAAHTKSAPLADSPVFATAKSSGPFRAATTASRADSAKSATSKTSEDIRNNLQRALHTSRDLTPLELLLAVHGGDGAYPGIEALVNSLATADGTKQLAPNADAILSRQNDENDGSTTADDAVVEQVPRCASLPAGPPTEEIDEDIVFYTTMESLVPTSSISTTPLVGIEMLARSLKSMDAGFGGGGYRSSASMPLSCTPLAGPWKPVLHVVGMMVGLIANGDSLIPASTCTKPQVDAHPGTAALLSEADSIPDSAAFARFSTQIALQQCPKEKERRRLLDTKPFSLQLASNVIFNTHAHTYYGQFLLEGCRWEVYSTDPDVERSELEGEELSYVHRHEQADRERIIVDQIGGIMDIDALHYVMKARAEAAPPRAEATIDEDEEEEL